MFCESTNSKSSLEKTISDYYADFKRKKEIDLNKWEEFIKINNFSKEHSEKIIQQANLHWDTILNEISKDGNIRFATIRNIATEDFNSGILEFPDKNVKEVAIKSDDNSQSFKLFYISVLDLVVGTLSSEQKYLFFPWIDHDSYNFLIPSLFCLSPKFQEELLSLKNDVRPLYKELFNSNNSKHVVAFFDNDDCGDIERVIVKVFDVILEDILQYTKMPLSIGGLYYQLPAKSDISGCLGHKAAPPCPNCSIHLKHLNIPIPMKDCNNLNQYYQIPKYCEKLFNDIKNKSSKLKQNTSKSNYKENLFDYFQSNNKKIPIDDNELFYYKFLNIVKKNTKDYIGCIKDNGAVFANQIFGLNEDKINTSLYNFNIFEIMPIDGFHSEVLGTMKYLMKMATYFFNTDIFKSIDIYFKQMHSTFNGSNIPALKGGVFLKGTQIGTIFLNRCFSTFISMAISENIGSKKKFSYGDHSKVFIQDFVELVKLTENYFIILNNTEISLTVDSDEYKEICLIVSKQRILFFYIHLYYNLMIQKNKNQKSQNTVYNYSRTCQLELISISQDNENGYENYDDELESINMDDLKLKLENLISKTPKAYNIHSIFHLIEDTLRFGNYLGFSTQLFEKLHQVLKKFIMNNISQEKYGMIFAAQRSQIIFNLKSTFNKKYYQTFYYVVDERNEGNSLKMKEIKRCDKVYFTPKLIETNVGNSFNKHFCFIEYYNNDVKDLGIIKSITLKMKIR
ncbi:hypothetical protein ACTFIR_009407 [Dictyostelium discoideum]